MPKDERLKNFTVKRDLMELLIKMFNLDISQIKIKEIPKDKK
jgi:hypothetical protein